MVHFPVDWWQGRTLIFGHRGASHAAPENTLPAFREAARVGAEGVELDVHLSADGVPVVIHDADVRKTTDGEGLVSAMPLAQIKELDAGSYFAARFAGTRIPTLEEVLAEVGQQLLVNIEIKDCVGRSPGLVEAVVNVVLRMGMQSRVWFSAFKPYSLFMARKYAPQISCGLLYGLRSLGVFTLTSITPYEALHPHCTLITERRVQRAHRRGLRVATWTVDVQAQAQALAAWGVDVIISNVPAAVVKGLS